ncbi:hypothetical protein pipiens_009126 [Culex pipiens pipiens]|uniref:Uncharacterized protein n=1 Tax=Culex pipiens pipiens TaxID=38569 RepID=A0ABD1DF66_CULPP
MLERVVLPALVPDLPEVVVTLVDQREDRLGLDLDRGQPVDRVATEEVTPKKRKCPLRWLRKCPSIDPCWCRIQLVTTEVVTEDRAVETTGEVPREEVSPRLQRQHLPVVLPLVEVRVAMEVRVDMDREVTDKEVTDKEVMDKVETDKDMEAVVTEEEVKVVGMEVV